jgi:hypothetical protein
MGLSPWLRTEKSMKKTRTKNKIRLAFLLTIAIGLNPVLTHCAFNPNDNCLNPASSCFVPDKYAPTISSSSPANNATIRSASELVTITFSEPMRGANLSANYTFSGLGGAALSISSVEVINNRTYRLTVSGSAAEGAVNLNFANITDWAGNSLQAALTFTASQNLIWTGSTTTTTNAWVAIAYGNDRFVIIGNQRVATSVDGMSWTETFVSTLQNCTDVTYGNGLFVCVGTSGKVLTSPDGTTWTLRTAASTNSWAAVTYGNGLFVAVASNGTADPTNHVMTSADGITWTGQNAPQDVTWQGVTYGNAMFVAVSSGSTPTGTANRVMKSADGIAWSYFSVPENNQWRKVTYGNGLFVAVANNSATNQMVMTSSDGENWTSRATPANAWYRITYAAGLFVAIASSGTSSLRSSEGITWTANTAVLPASGQWQGIAYGGGSLVSFIFNSNQTARATWP